MTLPARPAAAHLGLLAAAGLLFTLWRFPPAGAGFYPRCPVFFWLHLYCPGCGATRAAAALLHGRVVEAFRDNALAPVFLPAFAVYFAWAYARAARAREFTWPAVPQGLLALSLATAGAYALLRNL